MTTGQPEPQTPAEVWCDRCDQPSERVIETSSGSHTLCAGHAAALDYRIHSTAWALKAPRKGAPR